MENLKEQGNRCYKQGDFKQALSFYKQALQLDQ